MGHVIIMKNFRTLSRYYSNISAGILTFLPQKKKKKLIDKEIMTVEIFNLVKSVQTKRRPKELSRTVRTLCQLRYLVNCGNTFHSNQPFGNNVWSVL